MKKQDDSSATGMRLDKWLWCARFFKTRSMAAKALRGGKIKLNNSSPKPSKTIQIGDLLQIHKKPYQFHITVLKLSVRRRSATEAATLYQEQQQSIEARQTLALQRKAESDRHPGTHRRPSKQERRNLLKFKRINND